jgi:AcrR family transcriptional regulator
MAMDAIIEAAEQLFARYGIDGVSMRKIGAAAGSANHYSVQYHFGSKENLVRAIMDARLPDLEKQRGELLNEAVVSGQVNDVRALMRALLLPFANQTDAKGRHSYAAFTIHLYWHSEIPATWLMSEEFAPLTKHIVELLIPHAPVPRDMAIVRLRSAIVLFLHIVVEFDRKHRGKMKMRAAKVYWEDAINMATAAFLAESPEK